MTENNEDHEPASINEEKYNSLIIELKEKENFSFAIIAGILTSLIGAGIWAVVTVASGYQIGWMAIGVGFLVGMSTRFAGNGISPQFGYSGAFFALLGCVLGNFLSIVGFIAMEEQMGYIEVLMALDYSLVPEIMTSTFQPMDLLFYGLAVYEGYKFSFKQLSEEDIANVLD